MRFRTLAVITAVLTYATIIAGAHVRTTGSSLGCSDWPVCEEDAIFLGAGDTFAIIEMTHRYVAGFTGIAILATAFLAWRSRLVDPRARLTALAAAVLLPIQVGLGAGVVLTELTPWMRTTHLGIATALFAATVGTAIYSTLPPGNLPHHGGPVPHGPRRRKEETPEPSNPSENAAGAMTLLDHARLLKLHVVWLLVFTALAGYLAATGGSINWPTLLGLALGGALTSGGSMAINQGIEGAGVDKHMTRTRDRPVAAGRCTPHYAISFGLLVALVGTLIMGLTTTFLAMWVTMGSILLYAAIYTPYLKPTTPQNIVIGGAAGAAPPLIGWAAATGSIGPAALLMFLLIFLWTPAHFWALAIARREDYAASGLPMAPNVWGIDRTMVMILAYTLSTVASSLLLWQVGRLGWFYGLSAVFAGAGLTLQAVRLQRDTSDRNAMRFFKGSVTYMGVIFLAILVDRAVAPLLPHLA